MNRCGRRLDIHKERGGLGGVRNGGRKVYAPSTCLHPEGRMENDDGITGIT